VTGTTAAGGPPATGARPTVLALRALGLGDALTGVPALRGLRRAFPGHRLVLAAPAGVGGWLRDLGVVDDVLPAAGLAPLRWTGPGPDVAVNLHGRGPQSHRVLQATRPGRLVAFGAPEAGHDGPAWVADEHEVDRWCRMVRSAGGACGPEDLRLDVGPTPLVRGGSPAARAMSPAARATAGAVVLHPGAASGSRRWPVDRWGAVAACLVGRGIDVAVTGGPGETGLADAVVAGLPRARARSLAGALDLPALAAAVAEARLLVCGDTGVAHVATAVGTPSVLLFGPTPPRWWGPAIDVERHVVLWHGDPHRRGDPHGEDVDPALAAVTTDEVLDAVTRVLGAA
jgi:ADP-heptose:LPS heptosyltransferase